jgi:acetyl esterase
MLEPRFWKLIRERIPNRNAIGVNRSILGDFSGLQVMRNGYPNISCSGAITTFGDIPGKRRRIGIVRHRPAKPMDSDPPLMVFIHGGGWVMGSGSIGLACRAVQQLGVEVLGIFYSLSPEAGPGVALDEIASVWETLGHERMRIIIGDSAGGNLAASFAARTKDKPDAVVLVYPVIDIQVGRHYPSYDRFGHGYGLDLVEMASFIRAYVPNENERSSPLYSVINADLSDYPPTLVLTAQFDLLRDEGRAFAMKLRDCGRTVYYRCVPGVKHGFISRNCSGFPIAYDEIRRFIDRINRRNARS